MRALAEFILRGRIQAFLVAIAGSLIPLVSSATVGLVSLSKGSKEGILVFLWVSLPLLLLQQMGSENPLLTAVSIASLGLMVVSAAVHSLMASWQWTLLVILLGACLCALSFGVLMASHISAVITVVQDMLLNVVAQQGGQMDLTITTPLVLGLIAMTLAFGSIMSLMLARWWQAMLYNPGGFQKEFHSFSLDLKIAVILIAIALSGVFWPTGYEFWASLAVLPLLLAGIALVHFAAKQFSLGNQWLAFLYAGLILFGKPVTLILVGIGLADSIIDLRSKLAGYKKP